LHWEKNNTYLTIHSVQFSLIPVREVSQLGGNLLGSWSQAQFGRGGENRGNRIPIVQSAVSHSPINMNKVRGSTHSKQVS
jgi:hypothetical protein